MKSHKYFAFGSLICMIMAMLYDVFLYQKVRGGAMQDVLSERHLKISTFLETETRRSAFWAASVFSDTSR